MPGDCLFCRMASGAMDVDKLADDDVVFAISDIHPRAPVHFMVIPKQHIRSAAELTEEHGALLAHMMVVAKRLADEKRISGPGYRLVINVGREGGQLIEHLHMHVLGGRTMGAEG